MLVPLYGFLRGDTIGLIVLAQSDDTIRMVAAKLMRAAAVRVPPVERADVFYKGQRLDPALTVEKVGLTALERIDVVPGAR